MAPGTGADGLIGLSATKVTSAVVIPALVTAVVLALSGCGGGGSSSSSTAPGTPSPVSTAAGSGAVSKDAGQGSPSQGSGSSSNKATSANAAGAKQGPRITPQKGPAEPQPTQKQRSQATVADLSLTSPALQSTSGSVPVLPPAYTCDGQDILPALQWHGIPQGTAELALFVMNVQPVEGKLFFDWAVGGLDPSLGGLEAARLPKGAVVGTNSSGKSGYSICPLKGTSEEFIFALYALPKSLSFQKGFDPHQLRKEALQVSVDAGLMAAIYARG